jgi:hypothetical protein
MLRQFSGRLSLVALVTLSVVVSHPASAQSCTLEYRRADNMWAPVGQPSASLGVETVSVAKGSFRDFVTDWKYEKLRNNGTTYYGSHLRIATNRGTTPVRLFTIMLYRSSSDDAWSKQSQGFIELRPGETRNMRDDLYHVGCL